MRRYYIPSTTHGGGVGGFNTSLPGSGLPPVGPACPGNNFGNAVFPANPIPHTQTVNALRAHFRNWVMRGMPPPDSVWPRMKSGDLVEATGKAMGFPSIPSLTAASQTAPDNLIMPVLDYDWGPQFNYNDTSGVPSKLPPPIKRVLKMLVPRVDADGNELGGVPVVLRDAPLGTYLGWNITAGVNAPSIRARLTTPAAHPSRRPEERQASGDPCPSPEERYRITQATSPRCARRRRKRSRRALLQEDADALVKQAVTRARC